MGKVVLKLKFGDQFRRVSFPSFFSIEKLNRTIQQFFPNLSEYTLSYLDEEGDRIFLEFETELSQALDVAKAMNPSENPPLLRLDLNFKEADLAKKKVEPAYEV
mmetsp:Transcript_14084/g.19468  ORF Transcript_14084/g.19468 Transcript_14084/m.19468 type:complete len:104 (-) Transcript_14084:101-412(-)|eukprot:CAMPEP_0201478688 /NCGR_PEP_ID=MMETSP0151_2-20130828/3475_1 /ASSEMBLY_ACC=CAM_ASM_000257 /TAXON_ID=200890 /ORGANISM="Paramoeba atlantica, Strain 621/1 / CCAP 1560/9" /LENGTH=103 /DNA_ID=CAMNT_0047859845 /DNA_START=477 /DNA_END=788 /DNA_ORIENTATION=-